MTYDEYKTAFRDTLFAALLSGEKDGVALIYANAAVEQMLYAIALVLHNSPECDTPTKTRKTCDTLARRLQSYVSATQRMAEVGLLPNIVNRPEHLS